MDNKCDWTRPLLERLINLYEEQPCLYDPKHKFYSNKHARINALESISRDLNENNINGYISVENIKKKIATLRTQINHELMKIKSCYHSGMDSDDIYEPSVWWFEKFTFLKTYIKPRRGKSSLNDSGRSDPSLTAVLDENDAMEFSMTIGDSQPSDSQAIESTPVEPQPTDSPVLGTSDRKRKRWPISSERKQKKIVEEDGIMKNTLDVLQTIQNNMSHSRHMEFGRYVASELAAIDDTELLNDAKHEINNILYQNKKKFIAKIQAGVIFD